MKSPKRKNRENKRKKLSAQQKDTKMTYNQGMYILKFEYAVDKAKIQKGKIQWKWIPWKKIGHIKKNEASQYIQLLNSNTRET